MKGYTNYRKKIISTLSESKKVRSDGKEIPRGCWRGKCNYEHILPIKGKNTSRSRANAVHKYLGVSVDVDNDFPSSTKGGIHSYFHHLNSSQLLCYMVFRPLMTDSKAPTSALVELLRNLGLTISTNARCDFEFNDKWKWGQDQKEEGTSFDFHISNENHEYFFEIKFTENGFGKAKDDEEHKNKIKAIYLDKIKKIIGREIEVSECMKYYQLFRNIIRADSISNTIVFITDNNNPATYNEIEKFKKEYLDRSNVENVITLSWQKIFNVWPKGITKPFQFKCFEPNFSIT